jgi:hypothetical protein
MNDTPADTTAPLYCANHPSVETHLRCNNCNKPICPKCAVLTPTGYRCKECVRGQQRVFETATWYDYPLAFFTAGLLSFLGSLLVTWLGFLTLFAAPIAGTVIGEIVRLATRRRRAKLLFQIAAGAAALGALLPLGGTLISGLFGTGLVSLALPLIWQSIYLVAVTTTVYYRLGGIQIK